MSSVVWNPMIYSWLNENFRNKTKSILKCFVPIFCWNLLTGRKAGSHIPSVSERIKNGHRNSRRPGSPFANGLQPIDAEKSLTSWTSTTHSATGKAQAISELVSMSALLEQDLLDSSTRYSKTNTSNRNFPLSKEQRLALLTTQSGRRRHHSHQLIMMLNGIDNAEPITKTTSINLVSSSSSSSIEMEPTITMNTDNSEKRPGSADNCSNSKLEPPTSKA